MPGAPAGFVDTVETFGSGKLSMSEILQPAIGLAEEGCPISELSCVDQIRSPKVPDLSGPLFLCADQLQIHLYCTARASAWQRSEKLLRTQSPNGDEMLIDGKAPRVGQIYTNPTLAATFRSIAEQGKKGYYTGRIAQAIVDVLAAKGGVMTMEDLAAHQSEFVDPISYTYHDSFTLHECPPNGQGLTPLIALGILEQMQELGLIDLQKVEFNGVEYCHAVIEALRLAFADTKAYIADMQHGYVPVKELLSKVNKRVQSALALYVLH